MRKLVGLAVVAVVFSLSAGALAAGGPSGTYKTTVHTSVLGGALNGSWTLQLKNGKYAVKDAGRAAVNGSYKITGSKMSWTDSGGPDACKGTGVYKFKASGKTLKFTKVSDTNLCFGRQIVLSGKFTKV
jgi:hypothetical protein